MRQRGCEGDGKMSGVDAGARGGSNDQARSRDRTTIHHGKADPVRGLKGYDKIGANIMPDS